MSLICRPFSLNSFCLSKVWFRTHSVDLRQGDVTAIHSTCKSWLYQNMLEKPSELTLFRPVEEGGLGLHHVRCKALASLISTFMQTAANPNYQQSLYHSLLYRHYCLNDNYIPSITLPPYYSQNFFYIIKEVIQNTQLNPIFMTLKQWYRFVLQREVTMRKEDDGRMTQKLTRFEEGNPGLDWDHCYSISRLKGLSPDVKTFIFQRKSQQNPD